MPRGRILDKEAISQSRKLSLLSSDTGRLIYTWLLAHLDREGRFSADPSIIKGNIFPRIKKMTLKKIDNCLTEMSQVKLITLYKADGDKYLQFTKFKEYQVHFDREAPSKIPAPNKENTINSGINPIKSDLVPLTKHNITKLNITKYKVNSIELRLSELLFKKIKERNPEHKEPDMQKWAYSIDLMIRIDKRDPGVIEKIIIWCQQDDFWQNNILSTAKLRKQYDQLFMKMNATKNKKINKEQDWSEVKTFKEEKYKHKPIPSKIKTQIHKVLNIPNRDKLNKLKGDR